LTRVLRPMQKLWVHCESAVCDGEQSRILFVLFNPSNLAMAFSKGCCHVSWAATRPLCRAESRWQRSGVGAFHSAR
jgi:hypothetical protein